MRTHTGRVEEIQLDYQGRAAAWIRCAKEAIPAPGQYTLAYAPNDQNTPLGTPIFAGDITTQGFLSVPPIPRSWAPGTSLLLNGRFGRGFSLPNTTQRLGLIAFDNTITHLLPLAVKALKDDCSVAVLSDGPLPALPSALEALPLNAAPEAIGWADYLAIGVNLESLPALRASLGLGIRDQLPCPAQVFVLAPMPCSGLAECGACAVPTRRNWKMACKDGPVFELESLEW